MLRPCPPTIPCVPSSPSCVRASLPRSTLAAPDAVAKRRKTHQRTARENIADLVDPGSFVEYGALALAAQRARLTHRAS